MTTSTDREIRIITHLRFIDRLLAANIITGAQHQRLIVQIASRQADTITGLTARVRLDKSSA